jgi:predicted GTPase
MDYLFLHRLTHFEPFLMMNIDFSNRQLHKYDVLFVMLSTETSISEQDLSFAKIAHRRGAHLVFLVSKCDRRLSAESRIGEMPITDYIKARFVNKGWMF